MKNGKTKLEKELLLRKKAEELILKKKNVTPDTKLSYIETLELIHELDVHQIELEMQNEELLLAKKQAEIETDKFTNLYDFAPTGYLTLSKEGEIVELNFVAAQILGQERSLLINKRLALFLAGDCREIFSSFLDKVLSGQEKEMCEVVIKGNIQDYVVCLSGVSGGNGEQSFITLFDITESKKAEEALRLSEEKYRTLFESNRDSITIEKIEEGNKTSNFIEANHAATSILGYTKEELTALNSKDIDTASEKVRSNRIEALQATGKFDFETIIKTKNKKNRNVEVESVKIDYLGQPAVMNIIRDITERKQLEESTRKIYENMTSIIDAIPDSLFEADIEGHIYYYHSHRKNLIHASEDIFTGKLFQEVLPADAADTILVAINEANEKGWSSGHQYNLELPKGKRTFELSVSPIADSGKKNKHFIIITRDITEQKQVEKIKQESLTLIQKITSRVPGMVYQYKLRPDGSSCFPYSSEGIKDIYGVSPEEVREDATKIIEMIHPDDHSDVMTSINESAQNLSQWTKEFRIKYSEESYRHILGNAIPELEHDGSVLWYGYMYDITQQKETSVELLKLNRVLLLNSHINNLIILAPNQKNLFEESCRIAVTYGGYLMSWIGLVDETDKTVYSAARNGFEDGYLNHLKKISVLDIPEGRGPAGTSIREGKTTICNDIANDINMKLWSKEALDRGFKSAISIPINVRSETIGSFTMYSDKVNTFSNIEEVILLENITRNISFCLEGILIEEERKIHIEKIQQLSKAVEQSPVSVFITDNMGQIEYANQKFLETTGYNMEEVVGKNQRIMFSEHTSPEEYEQLWKTILDGKDWRGEFQNKKKDGSLYWESVAISPILNEKSEITHFIGIKEDITESKRLQKESLKAKEKAEESDRLKSAFLANMSHEIRTPMNGILGFTELLKEPKLSGEVQQEYIDIIEKSGARMLNIINDIINISKVEAGEVEISLSETNVNEQIEYLHTFFSPEVKQKGIQIRFNNALNSKEASIKTDCEKMYAILTNLVKNAIKFTNEGYVEFGYVKKGNFLEFYVKDSGMGISKYEQKFIFERFRQANESLSRNKAGSGLGLAISKAYIELLGGEIWVESELGKGSTFYFTIPYIKEQDVQKTIKVDIPINKIHTPIKKLKILIVEDDEISKLLMTIAVKKFAKEILKVSTGFDAIETCRNNPDIDLVMMDINMPEMDGYEATGKIRKFNKDLIIIAQTANGLSTDRENAINAGCTDYISKPVNIITLTELIEKYF